MKNVGFVALLLVSLAVFFCIQKAQAQSVDVNSSSAGSGRIGISSFTPQVVFPSSQGLSNVQITPISIESFIDPGIQPEIIPISTLNFSTFIGNNVQGSGVGPMQISIPRLITPTVMGKNVSLNSLKGLQFSDVYIADLDDSPQAKSYEKISENDLARFGVKGEVESPLMAELFPQEKEMALNAPKPVEQFPVFLYSVDELQLIEG